MYIFFAKGLSASRAFAVAKSQAAAHAPVAEHMKATRDYCVLHVIVAYWATQHALSKSGGEKELTIASKESRIVLKQVNGTFTEASSSSNKESTEPREDKRSNFLLSTMRSS